MKLSFSSFSPVMVVAAIFAIDIAAFFLIAQSLSLFSFSGQTFFAQPWGLLTFPFAHVDFSHLFENILALLVIGVLAFELELKGKELACCFLLSGISIALSSAFLFADLLIAGSSLGIYAVVGALSIKGSNFVSKKILIPVFAASILFCPTCMSNQAQMAFHFAGFLAGIGIFYLLVKTRKKKRILTEL